MKKTELLFNLISIPADIVMLFLAGIVAFYWRIHTVVLVGPVRYQLQLQSFLVIANKVVPGLILIFAVLGLYNLRGTRSFAREFGRVVIGVSLGLLVIILLFFFNPGTFQSRFIILAGWALGIIFVMLGRLLLRVVQTWLFVRGFGLHRLVIINGQKNELGVIQEVYRNKAYGYEIVAELDYNDQLYEKLDSVYSAGHVDEILQANPGLPDEANLKLVEFARNRGVQFSFVPNLFEVQRNAIETYNLKGIPVIGLKNTPLDGWGKVVKRLLDVIVSFVCLVLISPFFLIIALIIKLNSKGKVIYAAPRAGRDRNFYCYKFRTMYSHMSVGEGYGGREAEQMRQQLWKINSRGGETGPFLKIKHDPRVTSIGRYLRKTKLDEIPQFWNVLVGDMSMVGPRAHVLDEVQRYRNRYRRMFSIKPGIFGISQIAQISWPDLPFEEEIRLNTSYIENWSLWLDVKILAKSFWLLCFGAKSKEDY